MNALRYRPLAVFSTVFYISACFFAGASAKVLIIAAAICTAFIIPLIFFRKTRVAFVGILVLISLICSAIFSLFAYVIPRNGYAAMEGKKYVEGTVSGETSGGIYIADAIIDGRKVKITLETYEFITRGDKFSGYCLLSLAPEDDNFCKAEGISLTAKDNGISLKHTDGEGTVFTLNNRLSAVLGDKLGRDKGGFAAAVLLGNRNSLSPKLYSDLKALGLSHLIALSGLHLTVICGMTCLLARPFGKKAILITSAFTAVFYMIFTDMSASIVRAAVMLIIFSLAFFLKRDADVATTVGSTALIVTLFSPAAVFDLGFQLSLSAVAGVRCASAYLEEKWHEDRPPAKNLIASIISPFAVGLGATNFTMPWLLVYYGTFTWAGALMTVPMSLLLTLIIWMLPPLFVLPFDFYRDTVSFLIGIFEDWAQGFSDIGEFTLISTNQSLGAVAAALSTLGFTLALCHKRRPYKWITLITASALVAGLTVACTVNIIHASRNTEARFEETNDGDILSFKYNAVTLFIDVTSGAENSYEKICEISAEMGDVKPDALIIARPNSTHYNSLAESGLLYSVDVVYLPEGDSSTALAEKIDKSCHVEFYRSEGTFVFGNMTVEVLPALTTERSTRPALAFAVTCGGEKTVYLGSSYVELGGEVPICTRLWLGSFGPAYKKSFTVPPVEDIYVSSKAEKYLSIPLLP